MIRINKKYKMPKFQISCWVNNTGTTTVSAHVGASLVNVNNGIEYYNTADDIRKNFPPGKTWVFRNLNTDLGEVGKYDFYIALWEGEKPIGKGIKYTYARISGAVEKKKRTIVKLDISKNIISPTSFTVV